MLEISQMLTQVEQKLFADDVTVDQQKVCEKFIN